MFMIALPIALFYHTALGLRAIVEDCWHSSTKFAAVIAAQPVCSALAVTGIVSTVPIALGR